MKNFSLSFLTFVLVAGSLYVSRLDASPETQSEIRSKATPIRSKVIPLTMETIDSPEIPHTQTELHDETERETNLLASLSSDKNLKKAVSIESVNCEAKVCTVIAKLLTVNIGIFQEHLAAKSELGNDLLIEHVNDRVDNNVVSVTFSGENSERSH